MTDFVVSELELFCVPSGLMEFPDCESELLVVVRDSTVVLGAGAGAELSAAGAGDAAGAGTVTTVGAGGVCWHPVINISPITAGARETIHFEQIDFIERLFPDPLGEPILLFLQHVEVRDLYRPMEQDVR